MAAAVQNPILNSPMAVMENVVSAANGTSTRDVGGVLAAAVAGFQEAPIRYTVSTLLVTILVYLYRKSIPELDAKEPPVMLPRIPFIGHLVGMIRNQAEYYTSLQLVFLYQKYDGSTLALKRSQQEDGRRHRHTPHSRRQDVCHMGPGPRPICFAPEDALL